MWSASDPPQHDIASRPAKTPEEWTAWRGGPLQGRSATSGPLEWSETQNARWTYSIPGRGTSSPVIKDDVVIVTTSYPVQKATHLQNYASTALLLLCGAALYFGSGVLFQNMEHRRRWQDCFCAGSFASAMILLILLVVFGPAVLDFDRCPIRSWLGSSVILTFAFLLALTCCEAGSRKRLLLGICSVAFSVIVVQFIPSKAHAFRSGWWSSSSWVVFGVSLFPCSSGLLPIAYSLVRRRANWRKWTNVCSAGAATMSLLMNVVMGARIVSTNPSVAHVADKYDGILLLPTIAWVFVAVIWTAHVIALCNCLATRRVEVTLTAVLPGFTLSAATCLGTLLATCFAISVLMRQGNYLPYHLTVRRFDPLLGWQPCLLMLGGLVGALIATWRIRRLRESSWTQPLFQVCVLSLGTATFLSNVLLNKEQVLTRAIIAVDRDTGKFRWACEALYKPEGLLHRYNSAASPTAVIENDRIYAHFGSGGVMCSDASGRLLWTNEEIIFQSAYGAGSSPCVSNGVLVIVNGMPQNGYVCGLDCSTGQTLWRQPMNGNAVSGNSRSPIIRSVNGKMTVLVWGFDGLTGMEVTSGDVLFHYDIGNGGGDQVASLVTDDKSLYCIGDTSSTSLPLNLLGQSSTPPIAWTQRARACNCASPVIADDMAFCVTDSGVASCLDLKTGTTIWRHRLEGSFYASPVVCGIHVYMTNLDGVTSIIKVDRRFSLVAENKLSGQFLASAAPANGDLIFRSSDRLFCISGPRVENRSVNDSRQNAIAKRKSLSRFFFE